MSAKNRKNISLFLTIILLFFAFPLVSFADWVNPSANPPNNNTAKPINVGDDFQYKTGSLRIGGNGNGPAGGALTVVTGNVGIGTTNPLGTLQVGSGPVGLQGRINAVNTSGSYIVSNYDTATDITTFMGGDASGYGMIGTFSNHDLVLRTNNTERIRIASGGNVGIGTTGPAAKFHVLTTSDAAALRVQGSGTNVRAQINTVNDHGDWFWGIHGASPSGDGLIYTVGAKNFTIYTSGLERMRISSAGNIGIGTTNPGRKLTVSENVSGQAVLADFANINTGSSASSAINITSGGNAQLRLGVVDDTYGSGWTGGSFIYSTHANGWLALGTANAQRMTISSSGNVGIGTNNPSARLDIDGGTGIVVDASGGRISGVGDAIINSDALNLGYANGLYAPLSSALPAGTSGQTVRNNGTGWVADSNLYNNGTNIGIGTNNPGVKLQVGTTVASAFPTLGTASGHASLVGNGGAWGMYLGVDDSGKGWIQQMRNDAATAYDLSLQPRGGNVGIGTTNPVTRLDVNGAIKTSRLGSYGTYLSSQVQGIWSISEDYPINVGSNTFGTQYGMGYAYSTNGGAPFTNVHQIVFTNSGIVNASIGLNGSAYFAGNVGIGTTATITHRLNVNGTINASGGFYDNGARITGSKWTTSGANIYNNNLSGNVGIGDSSPNAPLTIRAASTADQALYQSWRYSSASDQYILKLKQTVTSGVVRYTYDMINNNIAYNNMLTFDRGNVGIGTTDPSSLLHLYKNVSGTNAEIAIQSGNGTTVQNKWAMYQDQVGGGLRFWNNDIVGEKNAVTILNNGNVGIGTLTPATILDIYGAIPRLRAIDSTAMAADVGAGLQLGGTIMSGGAAWTYAMLRSGKENATSNNADSYLAFHVLDQASRNITVSEKWRITSAGILQSTGAQTIRTSTGNLTIATGGNNGNIIMTPHGTGNVGIGTTNPGYKLDVNGDVNIGGANWLRFAGDLTLFNGAAGFFLQSHDNATNLQLRNNAGTTFSQIGLVSAARTYFNAGNVGIGTTNPTSNLHVYGAVTSAMQVESAGTGESGYSNLVLVNSSAGSGNGQIFKYANGATSWGGSNSLNIYTSNGPIAFHPNQHQNAMYIEDTGYVGIGTTNPTVELHVVGDAKITGELELGGADVAEEFVTDKNYEAGTVLVMGDLGYKSARACNSQYDTGVVGVVSDNASLIMGKQDSEYKAVVALVGVVKVKINNNHGIIKKGSLLTTSSVEGQAMLASDPQIGTIIGKALEDGNNKNEIMVLVNLQ